MRVMKIELMGVIQKNPLCYEVKVQIFNAFGRSGTDVIEYREAKWPESTIINDHTAVLWGKERKNGLTKKGDKFLLIYDEGDSQKVKYAIHDLTHSFALQKMVEYNIRSMHRDIDKAIKDIEDYMRKNETEPTPSKRKTWWSNWWC